MTPVSAAFVVPPLTPTNFDKINNQDLENKQNDVNPVICELESPRSTGMRSPRDEANKSTDISKVTPFRVPKLQLNDWSKHDSKVTSIAKKALTVAKDKLVI